MCLDVLSIAFFLPWRFKGGRFKMNLNQKQSVAISQINSILFTFFALLHQASFFCYLYI